MWLSLPEYKEVKTIVVALLLPWIQTERAPNLKSHILGHRVTKRKAVLTPTFPKFKGSTLSQVCRTSPTTWASWNSRSHSTPQPRAPAAMRLMGSSHDQKQHTRPIPKPRAHPSHKSCPREKQGNWDWTASLLSSSLGHNFSNQSIPSSAVLFKKWTQNDLEKYSPCSCPSGTLHK